MVCKLSGDNVVVSFQPPGEDTHKIFVLRQENRHKFITPKERAIVKFGIKPGMQVRFRFDGQEHHGIVNRINKRATVLVEDRKGQRYDNGKHYRKFYVPVQLLKAVD